MSRMDPFREAVEDLYSARLRQAVYARDFARADQIALSLRAWRYGTEISEKRFP